jgi:hypothetical protein
MLGLRSGRRDAALIQEQIEQGESTKAVTETTKDARDQFIKVARDMGLSKKAAGELADEYGLVPKDVKTKAELVDSASSKIRDLEDRIKAIERAININVYTTVHKASGSTGLGLGGPGFAAGGPVGAAAGGPQGQQDITVNDGLNPEAIRVPNGSTVIPSLDQLTDRDLGGGGGQGRTINIYVQGSIRSDRDLVQLIRDEIDSGGFRGAFGGDN